MEITMKITEERIDYAINKAKEDLKLYDFEQLYNMVKSLSLKIEYFNNWEEHSLENWFDQFNEDDILIYDIPSVDILKYLTEYICVDMLLYTDNNETVFTLDNIDINISLKDNIIFIDDTNIKNKYQEYLDIKKQYDLYINNENKNVAKSANLSNELLELIVEKNIDNEFEKIQGIDFSNIIINNYTDKQCEDEFKKLLTDDCDVVKVKKTSYIIKKFHASLCFSNIKGHLSPFDGWYYIQNNKDIFKKLYRNRLMYSDYYKNKLNINDLLNGKVPFHVYYTGLSASKMCPFVSYFKPNLAKYIVKKYLNEYNVIFDPFSGYSGRMLGILASGKSYIGQDLCSYSVDESNEIFNFIKPILQNDNLTCNITQKDSIKETGEYECLFTCTPYADKESWDGVEDFNYTCDKWIDICLKNYKCKRYVFVVDDKIEKYKEYIVESITNKSHFGTNKEYIIVIDSNEQS